MTDKINCKSIFISDIHLGSRGCQAEKLLQFLKDYRSDNLFLIGDIIDGWRLQRKWHFPQSHVNVIRKFLSLSKKGTNVYYIIGNHDEILRSFVKFKPNFGEIKISNTYEYHAINKKRYLIIHGDIFDKLMVNKKWLMNIGDITYDVAITVNTKFNAIRNIFGMEYWSLSKWLKHNTKHALNYVNKYENKVVEYCKKRKYDGIICGHIHTCEIKNIQNIEYLNDGDWVESCTAIIEDFEGNFHIIDYSKCTVVKSNTNTVSNKI
jgi:UDP-2,3-diacylglucosamine pyrophosphatase LpxH